MKGFSLQPCPCSGSLSAPWLWEVWWPRRQSQERKHTPSQQCSLISGSLLISNYLIKGRWVICSPEFPQRGLLHGSCHVECIFAHVICIGNPGWCWRQRVCHSQEEREEPSGDRLSCAGAEGSLLWGCDPWHSSVPFPNIPSSNIWCRNTDFTAPHLRVHSLDFQGAAFALLTGCCEPQGPPRIIKSKSWPCTNPKITHQEDAVGSNHALSNLLSSLLASAPDCSHWELRVFVPINLNHPPSRIQLRKDFPS